MEDSLEKPYAEPRRYRGLQIFAISILALIVGFCAFSAYTQDPIQKRIQIEGKGLYAPNAVYRIQRVIRTDDPEDVKNIDPATLAAIDAKSPLVTVATWKATE